MKRGGRQKVNPIVQTVPIRQKQCLELLVGGHFKLEESPLTMFKK